MVVYTVLAGSPWVQEAVHGSPKDSHGGDLRKEGGFDANFRRGGFDLGRS